MKVSNWDKWQTFRKDRGTPPWIKVYRNLLSNPEWVALSDKEKGQLVSIWMLAADRSGEIPDDPLLIQRMTMLDSKPNINKFIDLGFLTPTCQPVGNHKKISPPQHDAPEESRGEQSRVDESRVEQIRVDIVEHTPDHALTVFQYWQSVLDHPKAALDSKRKALIKKWLKHYDHTDLQKAILGCSLTPFNMGDNDRGQRYDSLTVIFKDADQIDRFMRNADSPPSGKIKTIQQTQDESRQQAARIREHMDLI